MKRRVAVVGLGAVSALGRGRPAFESGLRLCRPALTNTTSTVYPRLAKTRELTLGTVPGPRERNGSAGLDSFARFALEASREAISEAGVESLPNFQSRTAVVLGTATGGEDAREEAWERVAAQHSRPHPLTVVRVMANAAIGAVCMAFGLRGPAYTISTACASSGHAIGQAYQMVRSGMVDFAIAGGSEGLPGYTQFCAWQQMRVLADGLCRPFAAERTGITLAEGAGVMVLEPLVEAQARGARIYAELAGFSMESDGGTDWLNADPDGMLRCMEEALEDATTSPSELGYINAHATGTVRGDATEADAIRRLLRGTRVMVSSTKSLHGHALGATGALEAVATILGLSAGWLPGMPAVTPDNSLGLDLVWQQPAADPAPLHGSVALSNSFGFGGLNAALVFRRI